MLVTVDQKSLNAALAKASKAVNLNTTLPVLSNLLIKAENGKLTISGTNLEVAITVRIDAKVKNEGALTVPARLITSYVSLLPATTVDLETSGLELSIKTGKSKTAIKGISADEFPLIPQVKKENGFKVLASDLLSAIEQVAYAASRDLVRPVLAGVSVYADGQTMTFAATDSYRLAEKTIPLHEAPASPARLIIPTRTMVELSRVLEGGKDLVTVDLSANQILFLSGELEMASRLIEGTYPDYSAIIPKSGKTQVTIVADELIQAVKRVSLFMKDVSSVRIDISADKKVSLSSGSTQIGADQSEVEAAVTGDENSIGLNPAYLLDAIQSLKAKDIVMDIGDKMSPVTLKPAKGTGLLALIMPLKI